jgi:ATP-dependent Clp protease adapter protein ClpS
MARLNTPRKSMNDSLDTREYKNVVLVNDESLGLDFVMQALRHVLGKPELEAREIARMAGWLGRYSCGTYPAGVADAFVEAARQYGEAHGRAVPIVAEAMHEATTPQACSFCGAAAADVRKLLSGRNAFICDNCVRQGAESLAADTPHKRFNYVYELLEWHFAGVPKEAITSSNRSFPERVRADLQGAAEAIFAPGAAKVVALHGGYEYEQVTFTTLLQRDRNARTIGPLRYHDVDIGEDEPVACLENALWLRRESGQPVAVLMVRQRDMRGVFSINVEVATLAGDSGRQVAENLFRALEQAVQRSASYRGKVLSLEQADAYSGMAAGILVHRMPPVAREEVILPERTLELLERNILRFAEHRASLRALGQSAKKGLLFHGPPGTGKTHTIRYLAGALRGHTTLLITAEQVALLPEYFTLARLLQPSIVVIEDADLVARDRGTMESACEEVLLNKLLNEMDGLKGDAEVFFILTTNRPEMLEEALASRPGRVDQAIEFPLPDSVGRRKLLALYGNGLAVDAPLLEQLVARTEGVSAAFIKELMRRTAQIHLERGEGGPILESDAVAAMEEMLFSAGRLNRSLLGSSQAAGASA